MMSRLRFGIVGCGGMGQRHAKTVVETAAGTITAVVDADAARADSLAATVGARTYPDVESMLAADRSTP